MHPHRRHTSRTIVAALLLTAIPTACHDPVQAPSANVIRAGEQVTLGPGESFVVGALGFGFSGVSLDARCPAGLPCASPLDDAVAQFSVGFTNPQILAPIRLVELHTNPLSPPGSAYGYLLFLVRLDPPAQAGVVIRPEDYRAVVMVQPDTDGVAPR